MGWNRRRGLAPQQRSFHSPSNSIHPLQWRRGRLSSPDCLLFQLSEPSLDRAGRSADPTARTSPRRSLDIAELQFPPRADSREEEEGPDLGSRFYIASYRDNLVTRIARAHHARVWVCNAQCRAERVL